MLFLVGSNGRVLGTGGAGVRFRQLHTGAGAGAALGMDAILLGASGKRDDSRPSSFNALWDK